MARRVLLTGVSGRLGVTLAAALKNEFQITGVYGAHAVTIPGIETRACDLRDGTQVARLLMECAADIIVHCAAATDVEGCERDHALADELNHAIARILVDTADPSSRFVFISTDAVYGGVGPHRETDPVDPQNYYALTKYFGEWEFRRRPSSLILRTNFFGCAAGAKPGLAEWVIAELSAKRPITGFTDVLFSPLHTRDLSEVIREAIARDLAGVYNCGARTSFSKYDFALAIALQCGFNQSLVRAGRIADHAFHARRTADLRLDVSKLETALGHSLPTVEESVRRFCDDVCATR